MKFTKSTDGFSRTGIRIEQRIGLLEMVIAVGLDKYYPGELTPAEIVTITKQQIEDKGTREEFWPWVEGRELWVYKRAMDRVLRAFPALKCDEEAALDRIVLILEGR